MCDAEPQKANSMAFYRIDVVCFNCKQRPHSKSKSNTPEHCSHGFEWVDAESLGLAMEESSLSLARPNRQMEFM